MYKRQVLNERFNGKVAADIFDAVKKDVEAGVMQEYKLQRMLDGVDKDTSYMYNLMLNFTCLLYTSRCV